MLLLGTELPGWYLVLPRRGNHPGSEIISGDILAEIVKSNHSSTLGVATLGESIVFFSGVLAEVQIPRQSSPISITSIYNSVF